jgi:hypothetical protein
MDDEDLENFESNSSSSINRFSLLLPKKLILQPSKSISNQTSFKPNSVPSTPRANQLVGLIFPNNNQTLHEPVTSMDNQHKDSMLDGIVNTVLNILNVLQY